MTSNTIPYDTQTTYTFTGNTNETVEITPIDHASLALSFSGTTLLFDPVGDKSLYNDFQYPDVIFVTHEHADHFDVPLLEQLVGENTQLYVNPAVYEKLPENLQKRAIALANGDIATWKDMQIEAIPAYNIREEAQKFHPKGRDNGYIITIDGLRIYIS